MAFTFKLAPIGQGVQSLLAHSKCIWKCNCFFSTSKPILLYFYSHHILTRQCFAPVWGVLPSVSTLFLFFLGYCLDLLGIVLWCLYPDKLFITWMIPQLRKTPFTSAWYIHLSFIFDTFLYGHKWEKKRFSKTSKTFILQAEMPEFLLLKTFLSHW